MNKINKLLIISPYSTHKTKYHFEKLIRILGKNDIDCKLIDSQDYISKFFELKKYGKNKEFEKMVKEVNPDLILLDGHSELIKIIIKRNIPFLFLIRGNFWDEEKWARKTIATSFRHRLALKRKHMIFEKCIKNARIIVPISNYLKEVILEKFPSKKIQVIHMDARDSDEWTIRNGGKLQHPCVGLLQGAGIWGKTKEMMILPEILEKMPNVNFYWAGDGIYKEKILEKVKEFKNFHWIGNLNYPNEVQEFLSEIDVYALFSGMDGLGQSVIEASLMEKPVVASKSGGIPETIKDQETGYLVNQGDTQDWINKLSIILENTELSKKLGSNGRKYVKGKFDWVIVSKKIIDLIKNDFT